MATIVARGYPTYVASWEEGPPDNRFTVWCFRMWCRTDAGTTYARYVDVAARGVEAVAAPEGGWSSDVLDTLYRSQLAFEKNPDVYGPPIVSAERVRELEEGSDPSPTILAGFKERENKDWQSVADWASDFNLPSHPNNPEIEHIGGPTKCWCKRTHPPHKDWQADCSTAPCCWCRQKHCGIKDPELEHHPGECWCGATHPDHMMNWTLGACWCGKTGVHNVGMGNR
jgi:hypothetical protein